MNKKQLNFWKQLDSECDNEIILKEIERIKKEAREERDLIWIDKIHSNVNFKKGDVEKILKEIEE